MSNPNPNKKQDKPVNKQKENVTDSSSVGGEQKSKADLRRERKAVQVINK